MPDCYFVFFAILAIYFFINGYHKNNRILFLLSGLSFGLSFLFKLIAIFPFVICLISLFYITLSNARLRQNLFIWNGSIGFGFLLVTGVVSFIFYSISPDLFQQTIGHHLNLGKHLSAIEIIKKNLYFLHSYLKCYLFLLIPAILGILRCLAKKDDNLRLIFVFLVLSIFLFIGMSRELYFRHLMYAVFSFVILGSAVFVYLFQQRKRIFQLTAIFLLSMLCYKCVEMDLSVLFKRDNSTGALVNYIKNKTQENDYILSDYAGLNFYSQRYGPPIAARLCGTSVKSGQIKASDLIKELNEYGVRLILLHMEGTVNFPMECSIRNQLAFGPHHLINLRDYGKFIDYVTKNYTYIKDFDREGQIFKIFIKTPANNYNVFH